MDNIEMEFDNWRGYSAYEVAVRHGYIGTEAEWVESLKGRDGGTAKVNNVAHDANGNVRLYSANITISANDGRTLALIAQKVFELSDAISVVNGNIDLNGRYIDNALFR